ncbi:hypothetical protein [Ramlibacter sp.]|uniref:hypothetical protein n=1 Tax=Ramlibacter sp. TaxID=1917967 RepID=UPI002D5E5D37|nr:hypothetical protein [Ramlibacter sp.]HYD75159.1 hypothetical protein [Ramlibacter sp.]
MNLPPGLPVADRNLLAAWAQGGRSAPLSIEALNAGCFCVSLDADVLSRALEAEFGSPEILRLVQERCPYLFSARPVFVSHGHMDRMARVVKAVETVAGLATYREHVLARSPEIARHTPGARGVFFGYDFHVAEDAFGLIEVNTNAGGAMLNAVLARAHRACCLPVERLGPTAARAEAFERAMVDMFHAEWRRSGRTGALQTIAIVDESPRDQYLYPEFLLFQRLFERSRLRAVIADPGEFRLRDGALYLDDTRIDLVYNRLTDFYLDEPASAAIRAAYLADGVVLTPHPQAHALYADKRNLAVMSDGLQLEALGVPAEVRQELLAGVPHTVPVDASNANRLWAARRRWFFKPFAGFGSRAAYRGDKLTQRVWSEIVEGGYVAQALVAPGERSVDAGPEKPLKFDLREYVYEGVVQWSAARLYQGQTTNFRTPGGGFAPVYEGPL